MKIRIQGNFVRLRLTQTEIDQLGAEGTVSEITDFGNEKCFKYSISLQPIITESEAELNVNEIRISVPLEIAQAWIKSEQVGLQNDEYTRQGTGLKLLIEKDFQCLHDRENEDESDAFPNPNARHS